MPRKPGTSPVYYYCIRCGDDMEEKKSRLCPNCAAKSRAWSNGTVWLVVSGGGDFQNGAHFNQFDFDATLHAGSWPDGMVVEKWYKREYKGVYVVSGNTVKKMKGEARGDGLYLVPGRKRPVARLGGDL